MIRFQAELQGICCGNPQEYSLKALDPHLAMATASIVTAQKIFHLTNNEDAAGITVLKDGTRIAMVADGRFGSYAAEAAVCKFPDLWIAERKKQSEIEQVFLQTVLHLAEVLAQMRRSGESSISLTQFCSVVHTQDRYLAASIGDCELSWIQSQTGEQGKAGRVRFYNECERSTLGDDRPLILHAPPDDLRWNNQTVAETVHIRELVPKLGDVFFLSSDGYNVSKKHPRLPQVFRTKAIAEGVRDLMEDVMAHREEYDDNVTVAAMGHH